MTSFKVNICCAHHQPVTQHGHISSPRWLHPDTSLDQPDRDSKRNGINVPGLRRISAQRVRNRLRENDLRARRPYFEAVLIRRHRIAKVWWCCSKGLGHAKLEASLVQRWIKIHAAKMRWPYTCLQTPKWEVCKELRPWGRQFRWRKCDDVGCDILRLKTQLVHIHGNLNAARYRYEVLTQHMLPTMNPFREVFQHNNARPHTARMVLLTF